MPKVMPEYKEEVRKKIVRAAIGLSDKDGLANIRMEDVAKQLGISRATLYLYFKNREDLVAQAHRTLRRSISDGLNNAFNEENFEDVFSAIFDNFIYPADGFGTKSIIEMFARAVRDEQMNAVMKDNYRSMREMIVKIIEEQKNNGLISGDVDPVLAAGTIQSLTLGIKMASVVGLEREEAKIIWKTSIERMMKK